MNRNDYLMHYGVKGMKWGVRKEPDRSSLHRAHVREYSKAYNKASSASDKADDLWRNAKSQYKGLGRNKIQRIRSVNKVHKGHGSSKAKEYVKTWDAAEKASNEADKLWADSDNKYRNIGKTWVSRTYRIVKYG